MIFIFFLHKQISGAHVHQTLLHFHFEIDRKLAPHSCSQSAEVIPACNHCTIGILCASSSESCLSI
jgi:hypothetical protein